MSLTYCPVTWQSACCFKCRAAWFEDHRPAPCAMMSKWGESVYRETSGAGSGLGDDAEMLDRMYIYQNTVRCPSESPNRV